MDRKRPWEALPNLALANIFCRTSIKDRSHNIPFVCRSWAHAARHPPCWASMVAENHYFPGADRKSRWRRRRDFYLFLPISHFRRRHS
ncbi:hypothetical protein ABFS82_02G004700 [Erythranthe guttata]